MSIVDLGVHDLAGDAKSIHGGAPTRWFRPPGTTARQAGVHWQTQLWAQLIITIAKGLPLWHWDRGFFVRIRCLPWIVQCCWPVINTGTRRGNSAGSTSWQVVGFVVCAGG